MELTGIVFWVITYLFVDQTSCIHLTDEEKRLLFQSRKNYLTEEQARVLSPETGQYEYTHGLESNNNVDIQVLGDNGITIGCYGTLTQQTTYYTDATNEEGAYNVVQDLDTPIDMKQSNGKIIQIAIHQVLPQCRARLYQEAIEPKESILRTIVQAAPPTKTSVAYTPRPTIPNKTPPVSHVGSASTPRPYASGPGHPEGISYLTASIATPRAPQSVGIPGIVSATGPSQPTTPNAPPIFGGYPKISPPTSGLKTPPSSFIKTETRASTANISPPPPSAGLGSESPHPYNYPKSQIPFTETPAARTKSKSSNIIQPIVASSNTVYGISEKSKTPAKPTKSRTPNSPPITQSPAKPATRATTTHKPTTTTRPPPPAKSTTPNLPPIPYNRNLTPSPSSEVPSQCVPDLVLFTNKIVDKYQDPFPISFDQCTCTCPNVKRVPTAILQGINRG